MAVKTDAAPAAEEARPVKIAESEFAPAESRQAVWFAEPPAGTERAAPLKPIFWTHVARKMAPLTLINIMPKDGRWYGEYLVVWCDKKQAKVKELHWWSLDDVSMDDVETDQFLVKWIAPPVRYGVIRKADGDVLKDGFATKEDAVMWMKNNIR